MAICRRERILKVPQPIHTLPKQRQETETPPVYEIVKRVDSASILKFTVYGAYVILHSMALVHLTCLRCNRRGRGSSNAIFRSCDGAMGLYHRCANSLGPEQLSPKLDLPHAVLRCVMVSNPGCAFKILLLSFCVVGDVWWLEIISYEDVRAPSNLF